MKALYTTKATSKGGREGVAKSEDGNLEVKLVLPKEMGGAGGDGTNPEQLFAAGYSACFHSALRNVAMREKIKLTDDTAVTATVSVGPRDDGQGFGIDVALTVSIPGLDRDVAEDLAKKAHIVCPYSHALRVSYEVPVGLAD
ncbi:organic hydroperoxide resistance protein [Martelella alba]|uniref:Organic hydroperoxide resistance protein n=1 Tax=Martelella alba TaxID=2590451 RepID=A0A506UB55_9HYPH|nr:organic hydroperoxide resistance protein [Martelella alba]TPW30606.1 organic hydroperoxide resistance protein [Martelella alba]